MSPIMEVRPLGLSSTAELGRVPPSLMWTVGVAITLLCTQAMRSGTIPIGLGVILLAAAWVMAALMLWQRNVCVFATDATAGVVTMLGRRHQFGHSQIRELRLQAVDYAGGLRYNYLLFIGTNGDCLISLARGDTYPAESLQRLAAKVGITFTDKLDDPLDEREFNSQFPRTGSTARRASVRWLLGLGAGVAFIGFVLIVILETVWSRNL